MKLTHSFLLIFIVLVAASAFAAEWPPVSAEDRALTSIPEQPGASAVILQREETDDNMNNILIVYERIKILTDAGRKYATVELPSGRPFTIAAITGRSVQPDGSMVPFAGKPFDKVLTSANGARTTLKAFTFPNAQPGTILDFRYSLRYMDHRVFPPEWQVQTDLFQRKAYFKFIPLQNRGFANVRLHTGQIARSLAWTPFLTDGPQPEVHTLPAQTYATVHDVLLWIDLTRTNIPALVEEPFSPPASMLRSRVEFYYQTTLKADDYWKDEGKFWNKDVETFIGRDAGIAAAAAKVISPTDSAEQKLRSLYAFVSSLKNETANPDFVKEKGYPLEYRSPECIKIGRAHV